uniref:Zgc:123297 n=1 Tax=Nothobranchius kadleci TaxID=1051664 RepID=A0A1A8EKZ6_NOTKA
MWTRALDQIGTAALYLGLVLSHLVGEGSSVKVFSRPGQLVTLPCSYQYESRTNISQLSVQWRSPANDLLCHYIKHKSFQNCSTGYTIHYRPGNISLIIQQVQTKDIGTHICSVSKRHEFSDFSVDLDGRAEPVTSPPMDGVESSGFSWSYIILQALICLSVG